jgi:excisionase family DNA binding protein
MQQLVRVKDAARLTGISESTWRSWILKRRISFVKLGRSVRISRKVLRDMVSAGTVQAHRSTAKLTKGKIYE